MDDQTSELIKRLLMAINGCWTFNEYGGVCDECAQTLAWLEATFPDVETIQNHGYESEASRSRVMVGNVQAGTVVRIPRIGVD